MAFHRSKELSIIVEDPLIKTDRTSLGRLTSQLNSYRHEVRTIGGYWAANMTINDNQLGIEEWIAEGIGRHIKVYNPDLVQIWEGFVDKISATLGPLRVSVGPLLGIGNRVNVRYSTITVTDEGENILGSQVPTASSDNSESITLHGIIEKTYSINGATDADALQLRDMLVNDPTRAFPATDLRTNLSGSGQPSVTLSCLGYWHWLKAYFYGGVGAGTQDLDDKIQDIITLDPNSIFSTDFSKIDSNTTQVSTFADFKEKAETIIKRLNSQGDASNNSYMIGCFNDRQFVYTATPNEVEIQQRITGNRGFVNQLDSRIEAWDVDRGQWLFIPDFLVGRFPPITAESLGTDPRASFLEVVKFSAPNSVDTSGTKLSEIDQVLAKRGLGGIA